MATLRRSDDPVVESRLRELLAVTYEGYASASGPETMYARGWLAEAERMRRGGAIVVAAFHIPEEYRQGYGVTDPFNLVLGEDGRLRPLATGGNHD